MRPNVGVIAAPNFQQLVAELMQRNMSMMVGGSVLRTDASYFMHKPAQHTRTTAHLHTCTHTNTDTFIHAHRMIAEQQSQNRRHLGADANDTSRERRPHNADSHMHMLLVALIIATSFYLNAGGVAFDDSFVPGGRNQYDVTAAPFLPPSQHIEAAKGMGGKYLGLGTSQQ